MCKYTLTGLLWLILSSLTLSAQTSQSHFLYFLSDQATLDDEDKATISNVVLSLEQHSSYNVEIVGHTDQDGSDEYNHQLAKKRSHAVHEYLVSMGFPENKIRQNWKGEKDLVTTELTSAAKQKNRRVELKTSYHDFQSVDDLTSHVSEDQQQIQKYTVEDKSQLLDLDKGSSIYIPKGAFAYKDGSPVTGPVEIEVIEAFKLTDFMSHDLSTDSHGELLETGGMLYINATSNGHQVQLAENRSLEIIYPVQAIEEGMELFYGEETDSGMTWASTSQPLSTTQVKNDPIMIDLNTILDHDLGDLEQPKLDFLEMPKRPGIKDKPFPPSDRIYSGKKFEKLYANYEKNLEEWHKRKPKYEMAMADWNKEVNRRLQKIDDHKGHILETKYKVKLVTAMQGIERMSDRRAPLELVQKLFSFINRPMRIDFDDRAIYKKAFQNYARDLISDRKLEINVEGYLIHPKTNDFCNDLRLQIYEAEKYAKELKFKETGRIDRAGFGSYIAGISKLGWINCDRFSGDDRELSDLEITEVAPNTKHYLIYKTMRSFVSPTRKEGYATFKNVAVGERVKIVALKLVDEKPYMAIKDLTLGADESMVLDFFPCDLEQIRHELNSVDPTVTKVAENEYDLSLNVFPNPTTVAFTASVQPAEKLDKLMMYDLNGALVKTVNSPSKNVDENLVSVSELNSGVYVVTATFDNGRIASQRLVIN